LPHKELLIAVSFGSPVLSRTGILLGIARKNVLALNSDTTRFVFTVAEWKNKQGLLL